MDRKRSRDPDDEDDSALGKRTRLAAEATEAIEVAAGISNNADVAAAAVAATAAATSNAMQAVAHEALAITNGGGLAALASAANSLTTAHVHNSIRPKPALVPASASAPAQVQVPSLAAASPPTIAPASASPSAPATTPVAAGPVTSPTVAHAGAPTAASNGTGNAHVNNILNIFNNGVLPPFGTDLAGQADNGAAKAENTTLETMSDITRCFRNAVLKGWDRRSPTYDNVDVLLLYWEEDLVDPHVEVREDVIRLESVFRSTYHYQTHSYGIRSNAPEQLLYGQVQNFLKRNNHPSTLSVVYYAGKAIPNNRPEEPPTWVPRRKSFTNSVESKGVQTACENTICDVLLLLDFSSGPHHPFDRANPGTTKRNSVEVLDCPSLDPDIGGITFSKALAEELEAAAVEGPIDIATLHTQVTNRMALARPRGRGRPPKEINPSKSDPEQKHSPRHYFLYHKRPIILTALPNEPQVVLCLRVLGGSVDVNQWGKWIYDAVPEARQTVKVEGLYSGFSTMIVIRVPVSQWHLFSACPAGSFVAYTTIGEIDPETMEKIDEAMVDKLWMEPEPEPQSTTSPSLDAHENIALAVAAASAAAAGTSPPAAGVFGVDGDALGRAGQKRARKALPTARKILPSEASQSNGGRRRELVGSERARDHSYHHHHHLPDQSENGEPGELGDNSNPLLAAAAQKPFKISIKLAGQTHLCKECKAGFKDADSLHNHVRKQHTRPFQCVFNWAGCESTFASKNEWKRHVMSQHILLQYWVCQVDLCSKVVNKVGVAGSNSDFSLPNGAIFNRKDLFTQHLRRMHTPPHVKKLMKQAKQGTKMPNHPAIVEWENRLKELQHDGLKPRCCLPDYMICPALGCAADFHGNNAWDDRMEHVARHLESAAAGRESQVIFGGKTDTTLTSWATRPEVGIAKRVGPDSWHLDNPLRPEIMAWTEGDDETPGNGHAPGHEPSHEHKHGNGHGSSNGTRNGTHDESYPGDSHHHHGHDHDHIHAHDRFQVQYEEHESKHQHIYDEVHLHESREGPIQHGHADVPRSRERSRSVIEVADAEVRRSSASTNGLDEVHHSHIGQHHDSRTAIAAAD